MNKRDSKRRWKARRDQGKWIPMYVMAEYPELRPKPNEALVDLYYQYLKWMKR